MQGDLSLKFPIHRQKTDHLEGKEGERERQRCNIETTGVLRAVKDKIGDTITV